MFAGLQGDGVIPGGIEGGAEVLVFRAEALDLSGEVLVFRTKLSNLSLTRLDGRAGLDVRDSARLPRHLVENVDEGGEDDRGGDDDELVVHDAVERFSFLSVQYCTLLLSLL